MSKEKFSPALEKVLTMMCEAVGVKYEDVDFNEETWYMQHDWTKEQQDQFKQDLYKAVTDSPKFFEDLFDSRSPKKILKTQIEFFIMSYGWKTHYNIEH